MEAGTSSWSEWSREAVGTMRARNEAWVARFGLARAPYRWELDSAELVFERAADEVVADICLVGTASEAEGTFMWAWHNDVIPDSAKRGLELVRAFGASRGLPLLTTPTWPGGRAEGLEMLAAAGRIQDASGGLVDRAGDLLMFFTLHRFRTRPRSDGPTESAG